MDLKVFNSFKKFSKDHTVFTDKYLVVTGKAPITSSYLTNYLSEKGIPLWIAKQLLRQVEVRNEATGKNFIALGHRNEDGGYALQNAYVKANTMPLTITFIRGQFESRGGIHIFKDDLDYLTALARFPGSKFRNDVIILNAPCNIREAAAFIYGFGYRQLYTWLGNDKLGKSLTRACRTFCYEQEGLQHSPMNDMYRGYPDLNTWHIDQLRKVLKGGK